MWVRQSYSSQFCQIKYKDCLLYLYVLFHKVDDTNKHHNKTFRNLLVWIRLSVKCFSNLLLSCILSKCPNDHKVLIYAFLFRLGCSKVFHYKFQHFLTYIRRYPFSLLWKKYENISPHILRLTTPAVFVNVKYTKKNVLYNLPCWQGNVSLHVVKYRVGRCQSVCGSYDSVHSFLYII